MTGLIHANLKNEILRGLDCSNSGGGFNKMGSKDYDKTGNSQGHFSPKPGGKYSGGNFRNIDGSFWDGYGCVNYRAGFTDPKSTIISSSLKAANDDQSVMTKQRKKDMMSKNEEFEENFYIKQLDHESLDILDESILVMKTPNKKFDLASLEITGAFIQAEKIDRELFEQGDNVDGKPVVQTLSNQSEDSKRFHDGERFQDGSMKVPQEDSELKKERDGSMTTVPGLMTVPVPGSEQNNGSTTVPQRFHDGERLHDGSMTVPVTSANLEDVKTKSRFEESGGE